MPGNVIRTHGESVDHGGRETSVVASYTFFFEDADEKMVNGEIGGLPSTFLFAICGLYTRLDPNRASSALIVHPPRLL